MTVSQKDALELVMSTGDLSAIESQVDFLMDAARREQSEANQAILERWQREQEDVMSCGHARRCYRPYHESTPEKYDTCDVCEALAEKLPTSICSFGHPIACMTMEDGMEMCSWCLDRAKDFADSEDEIQAAKEAVRNELIANVSESVSEVGGWLDSPKAVIANMAALDLSKIPTGGGK